MYFYPRSPCGERPQCRTLPSGIYDFYPRSLAESDGILGRRIWYRQNFFLLASTLSLRERRCIKMELNRTTSIHALLANFLSTLSLRRATPDQPGGLVPCTVISIHALLAESDAPPAPRLESSTGIFLSTLSLRRRDGCRFFYPLSLRATTNAYRYSAFFYPRSLRRATYLGMSVSDAYISIHALLAESDAVCVVVQSPA